MFHRADEADPAFDLAIVEHQARAGTCTAARPDWLLTSRTARGSERRLERLIERDRPVALALGDGEQPGLGAGAGMGVDRLPVGDDEALGRQRLQPDIIGAGRDRALDPRGQQLLERGEQDVLQIDGQRQQPIEEGRDRRQLVLDAVGVGQLQPGRVLERLKRAALDLAARPAARRAGAAHRAP